MAGISIANYIAGVSDESVIDWSGYAETNEEKPDCENEGITDEGIFTVANIRTAIATATAASSLYNALKMAKLRKKIGDAYAKIAEDQRNYYNDKYKPIELSLIKEASEWEDPEVDPKKVELNRGQMVVSARFPFVGKIEKAMRCTGRFCTGQRAAIMNDMLTEQMAAEAMVSGLSHRYAKSEEQVRENQRWEFRRNVLNIGRNIPGEASAYADLASGIFGSLGKQHAESFIGVTHWWQYNNDRRDTVYNPDRGPMRAPQYNRRLPAVVDSSEPYSAKAVVEPVVPEPPIVEINLG